MLQVSGHRAVFLPFDNDSLASLCELKPIKKGGYL